MKKFALRLLAFLAFASMAAADAIQQVSLERTPCYGFCPVYKVTIFSDGKVVFEGSDNVQSKGHFEGHVSSADFAKIQRKADEIHFWTLRDEYLTKELSDGTTQSITDAPTQVVTVKTARGLKRIVDYYGAPDELRSFEHLIDEIAEVKRWIGVPSRLTSR